MVKNNINYKAILNQVNLRATDERLSLLKTLYSLKKPATLKTIIKKVKDKGIHEVTLYRTLAVFKEAKLVRQTDFGDSVPYFEFADHEHDHHHIICTSCKKIADFVGCGVEAVSKKALSQSREFSRITGHSFEFFGLCKKCV